jgi:nitroreductase
MQPTPENPVEEAIVSRRSVRGFLPDPVPRELLEHLIEVAARAPSGSNTQPWQLHVLTGAALRRLSDALHAAFQAGEAEHADYAYYPLEWRSPYLERRRANGLALYALTGVARGDKQAAMRQRGRNYRFFGAPVELILTLDKDMQHGAFLDSGMFLQNLMLAARARGLDSCAQASLANYPGIVARHLGLGDEQRVVCGLALGWADPQEPANALRTPREPLERFCRFHAD